MARPGVSYVEVAKTATQLIEQDINPTVESIRNVIGSGSNSTINRHLRDWRSKQGQLLEAQKGIPSSLLIAVKGLYDAMTEGAEQKISKAVEAAEQKINEIDQQKQSIEAKNMQLQNENQSIQEALETALKEIIQLKDKLDATEKALSQQVTDNHHLNQRIDDKKDEFKRLENQIDQAQNNLEHYREAIRQQREEEKLAHEEALTKLQQQFKIMQNDIAESRAENKWLQQAKAELEEKLGAAHNHINEVKENQQEALLEIKKQKLDYGQLQTEYDKIMVSNKDLNVSVLELKERNDELSLQLMQSDNETHHVKKQLQETKELFNNLLNKNDQLVLENSQLKAKFAEKKYSI